MSRTVRPGRVRGHEVGRTKTPRPKPTRPPTHRPGSEDGIAISIGPVLGANEVLKHWLTFPVTPAVIPISGAAVYVDGKQRAAPGYGERAHFVGPGLEGVSFEGRLEPPRIYLPGGLPPGATGPEVGTLDSDAEINLGNALLADDTGRQFPFPARIGRADPGVVMDTGARAGPSTYLEPHAFRATLAGIRDKGEVIRLVIGDQYGWNRKATIREFTWRFEDPDPDVLLYAITFKEHEADRLTTVGPKPKKKTPKDSAAYTTRRGDTLARIAADKLKDANGWKKLIRLNRKTLARLYLYPPVGDRSSRLARARIDGQPRVPRLGEKGVERLSPDVKFHDEVRLKLR